MFRFVFLLVTLSFFIEFAYADEYFPISYPVHLSVWVDESKNTSIEEVITKPFKETNATAFSGGYTRKVHWFKITLTPFENSNALILTYYLQGLDDVRLYVPKTNGGFLEQRSGDKLPFHDRAVAHRELNFWVDTPTLEPVTAYLRLQTTSSSLIAVTAWQPQAFQNKNHIEYFILGTVFGVLFMLLIINLSLWRWFYDPAFRYYFLYLFSSIIYLASMNGLLAEFVVNDSGLMNHYVFSVVAVMTLFFATMFYKHKLKITSLNTPVLYWLLNAYQVLLFLCVIAIFLDYFTEVMVWVNRSTLAISLLVLIRAFHVWRHHQVSGLIIIALIFGLLSLLASSLTLLGILETQTFFVYGPQLGIVATMLTLQLLLVQRIRQLQDDQKAAELRVDEAEKHNQLQEKFMAMLTHELKTPLSVIRVAIAKPVMPSQRLKDQMILAINDISMIIDRCSHSEKITAGKLNINMISVSLVSFIDTIIQEQVQYSRVVFKHTLDCDDILTDPDFLRIILTNLLDNSFKYSINDSVIIIELTKENDVIQFIIESEPNEAGFPDPKQVFEKYYRSSGAHQRIGAGLGLYIVKELVNQLGMSIHYRTKANQVIFQINIPNKK